MITIHSKIYLNRTSIKLKEIAFIPTFYTSIASLRLFIAKNVH